MRWKKIGNKLAPMALGVGKKSKTNSRVPEYFFFLAEMPSQQWTFKEFNFNVAVLSCGRLLKSDPQNIPARVELKLEEGKRKKTQAPERLFLSFRRALLNSDPYLWVLTRQSHAALRSGSHVDALWCCKAAAGEKGTRFTKQSPGPYVSSVWALVEK